MVWTAKDLSHFSSLDVLLYTGIIMDVEGGFSISLKCLITSSFQFI